MTRMLRGILKETPLKYETKPSARLGLVHTIIADYAVVEWYTENRMVVPRWPLPSSREYNNRRKIANHVPPQVRVFGNKKVHSNLLGGSTEPIFNFHQHFSMAKKNVLIFFPNFFLINNSLLQR